MAESAIKHVAEMGKIPFFVGQLAPKWTEKQLDRQTWGYKQMLVRSFLVQNALGLVINSRTYGRI